MIQADERRMYRPTKRTKRWYTFIGALGIVTALWAMRENDVLLLRSPVALKGWMAWWYRIFGWDRSISLAPFGHLRGDGDLVHDLRHYAPHLFAEHHERDEEART
jgi:hypothetical protein